MSEAVFSEIAMYVLLTALIVYMGFIVWDLAKKSQAGRFGTIALFTVLGAGVVGFIIKTILVEVMQL
ncbi:DUF2788 domain-containing protein [Marinobacter nanhaiticus D15-8W]|uniref:DUF2788 domain-containing protein n=1 Tax=Marinobacter nanhaiticus D15-8W TaxID=626887 RepID=N6WR45_9GAMM|nr:DUF2788 domain-containing protein [Marinobacter nanhaiticus]ENO13527.1 DUF2788 domain-containing protein [Marinobacter nanhaiticus D15-8W]BES70896.1 DUF2788 domain-containing protein [Marinobacter nanhaiticus D15-8W]